MIQASCALQRGQFCGKLLVLINTSRQGVRVLSFLRVQNLKKDENGNVISGSASIMDTVYDRDKKHKSRQIVVEKLGKVLWHDEEKGSVICFSPTRGTFEYDSREKKFKDVADDDWRLGSWLSREPDRHVQFGPANLFLHFLEKEGFSGLLKRVFQKDSDLQRVICHLAHSFLKDGSRIHCDDFINKTVLSHYATSISLQSLSCDTRYYEMMGDESVRKTFFVEYAALRRKQDRNFGQCCFIDSTPFPNDIMNNPFAAFSNHGTGVSTRQTRLVLVLDQSSLLPVWFSIIKGNVVDMNTLDDITSQVKELLDIDIREFVVDAGYATKETIGRFFPVAPADAADVDLKIAPDAGDLVGSDGRHFTVRMPERRGYPYKTLYHKVKDKFSQAKYLIRHEDHTYFATMTRATIFGRFCYAYVYVDKDNAGCGLARFLDEHMDQFLEMSDKDKNWKAVEGGFFILISTRRRTPKGILEDYFNRVSIEQVFKTAKEYLDILPLSKWNAERVMGKLLSDMITLTLFMPARKAVNGKDYAMTRVLGGLESSMALICSDGTIHPEYKDKKAKEYFKALNLKDFVSMKSDDYFASFGLEKRVSI